MRMRKTASLGEIMISKNFASVRRTTRKLARLNEIFAVYLSAELKSVCHIAAFEEGVLVVVTDHLAVASQLRYLSRIYLQQLQQHPELEGLKRLNVSLARQSAGPVKKAKPPIFLSPGTISLLEETARELGDPEISGALLRLASHGRDPSD